MTFFLHQEQARTRTRLLIALYILTVILIVISIYLGLLFVSGLSSNEAGVPQPETLVLWRPDFFLTTALCVVGLIALGTLYRVFQLASGGATVAQSIGGRLIQPDTRDPQERKILNVVEEIAIASGVQIPPVYVMDDEAGINAFAAGYKPNSAVIGISRGSLGYLTRNELQGVVAHEFSHILNGDMRLNIRLMSVLHGILLLTIVGRILIRSGFHSGRRRRSNERSMSGGLAAAGAVILVVGGIGALGAKLIKMAVSRQREFLADASAVQFTRDPHGISGALMKIGGLTQGSALTSPRAEDISHMCFSNALSGFFSGLALFSTHPPLEQRIQRIQPGFSGTFPEVIPLDREQEPDKRQEQKTADLAGVIVSPQAILASVGSFSDRAIQASHSLLGSLPQQLRSAAHTPLDAGALFCSLLLSQEPSLYAAQVQRCQYELPDGMYSLLERYFQQAAELPVAQRMALMDLTIESLRTLSKSQYVKLRLAVDSIINADSHVSLLEYTSFHILTQTLDEQFGMRPAAPREQRDLSKLVLPASRLLFALAVLGHTEPEAAGDAYLAACNELGIAADLRIPFEEAEEVSVAFLDAAIQPLEAVAPLVREKIFSACLTCITHDHAITEEEKLLIRAIGSILECPVPLAAKQ